MTVDAPEPATCRMKVDSDNDSMWLEVSFPGFVVRIGLPQDIVNDIILTGGRYFISPNGDGTLEIHEESCGGPLPFMCGTETIDELLDATLDAAYYEAHFTDPPPPDGKPNKHPPDVQHLVSLERCLEERLSQTREAIREISKETPA